MTRPFKYDYRSDTVTQPTDAMRAAMLSAPLGDDVMGDDPTVKKLEATMAERLGKDAAMLVPSGTQSNLTALMAHCGRGDEYIAGMTAHCYLWEAGGAAVLGSIQPQPIVNQPDGTLALDDIKAAIKPDDSHMAITRTLALENTISGQILTTDYMEAATALAKEHSLTTHLDGARGFNAAVGSGKSIAEIAKPFDTVSICLSKGLGAPVGSILVGDKDLINKARRIRKLVGGGMRQSGILAAAGLYAIDNHVERLKDDHDNAKRLAEGLSKHDAIDVTSCHTNIILARFDEAIKSDLERYLAENGVGIAAIYDQTRFVTHLDVDAAGIEATIDIFDRFFA